MWKELKWEKPLTIDSTSLMVTEPVIKTTLRSAK